MQLEIPSRAGWVPPGRWVFAGELRGLPEHACTTGVANCRGQETKMYLPLGADGAHSPAVCPGVDVPEPLS
jgi:hypothetical protein